MNRKVQAFLVFLFYLLHSSTIYAQGSTWYSVSSGSWGDVIWSSSPTGAATHSDPDDPSLNLVIQNGHDVTLQASEKAVADLTIQFGSSLKVGSSSTRYIEVYGDAILDGTVGGSSDGLSLDINGASCRISGLGQTQLKRLRKDNDPSAANTTNLVIDKNLTLTFTSSSSAALYNNGAPNSRFNITINAGKTVTVKKADVSIDGIDGSNSINLGGSFMVNGTLDIEQGDLWLASDNGGGYDITYEIGKNGTILLGGHIYGNENQAGTAKASLLSSGQLWLEDSGHIFQDIHPSRNAFTFQSGARVVFSQSNTQYFPTGITFPDVTIRGGGNKRLQADTQVNGRIRLEGGFITLGDHDLTISSGGNVTGGSQLSYIKTNGDGVLRRRVSSTQVSFPVGNDSYNPVKLFNTFSAATDWYGVRVEDVLLMEGNAGQAMVSEAIDRTWFIEEDIAGGSDLYVELQWEVADEMAGFDRQSCFISQWLGSEWQEQATDAASGNGPYRQQLEEVENVSLFSVQSSSPLPIELGYFQGQPAAKGILLQWTTLLEENNAYITVEKSANGLDFKEVTQMDGYGTSYAPKHYQFLDQAPYSGINYYRLKQVDFDGSETFHQTISVHWEGSVNAPMIYPTLANNYLNLKWPSAVPKRVRLEIYDMTGRLVKTAFTPPETASWTLETSALSNGNYILKTRSGSQHYSQRFLVNH